MQDALLNFFHEYPKSEAPFMHEQFAQWSETRPLSGFRVIHHVPVVNNTLLKIACLLAAGAEVTVTNPTAFCHAHPQAVSALNKAKIRYVDDPLSIIGEKFDFYFDCGAQLYQFLGAPQIGAIELTASGDRFYRQQTLDFPVISIDRTWTKQLETVLGCAESCHMALSQLTGVNLTETSWIIFGFGKLGRGLTYFCKQHNIPVVVVDRCKKQRALAQELNINALDPQDYNELEYALIDAHVVITATGQKEIMNNYPHSWFSGKILANLGIYDEYGSHFSDEEVLNHKMPVNFVLTDPTPMKYIDPEFYIHNLVALSFLQEKLPHGIHDIIPELDQSMIQRWCTFHSFPLDIMNTWFIP